MFSRSFFAQNIKILRKAHNLTIVELSDIFGSISKTTIGAWEKETNIPSLDTLDQIINLFSVSSDWLLGYSDEPYNEKIITDIEDKLLSEVYSYGSKDIPLVASFNGITNEYMDSEKRSFTYTLPVRANIIFLFHKYIAIIRKQLEYKEKMENASSIVSAIMKTKENLEIKYPSDKSLKTLEQNLIDIKALQDLLASKKSAKPIFDIKAQKTTEE